MTYLRGIIHEEPLRYNLVTLAPECQWLLSCGAHHDIALEGPLCPEDCECASGCLVCPTLTPCLPLQGAILPLSPSSPTQCHFCSFLPSWAAGVLRALSSILGASPITWAKRLLSSDSRSYPQELCFLPHHFHVSTRGLSKLWPWAVSGPLVVFIKLHWHTATWIGLFMSVAAALPWQGEGVMTGAVWPAAQIYFLPSLKGTLPCSGTACPFPWPCCLARCHAFCPSPLGSPPHPRGMPSLVPCAVYIVPPTGGRSVS